MPCDTPGHPSLRLEVLSSLACSRLAKEGLTRVLQTLLHTQAWDLGVAWLAEDDYLRHAADSVSPRAHISGPRFQAFVESMRTRVRPIRLPVEAGGGKEVCSCDPAFCTGCCLSSEPAGLGLRTAVALPLTRGDIVYGLIELFSCDVHQITESMREVLQSVANDLGSFLWSRRVETRARMRNARREGARRFARLAYWECAPATRRLRSAINMSEVLGINPAHLPGSVDGYLQLASEEDRCALHAAWADLIDPAVGSIELEHRLCPKDGSGERVMVVQGMADFDAEGNVLSISGTLQDITQYRRLEARLRLAATAIDHAGDAIVIFDARGAIMSVNSAFTRITGYSESDVLGRQLDAVLNRPSGRHDEAFFRRLLGRLRTFGRWKGELWARAKDGRSFAMLLSLNEIRDENGRVAHHVGVFTDISRQKEYKERLEVLALHDSLTGLPNRALFIDRGEQALSQARRSNTQVGVIFIDLDLFKVINDTWGHAVGDEVLCRAGVRMRSAMRDCDTVARLGGDEFVVLLTDVKGMDTCIAAAERLLVAITEPYMLNGVSVSLGASMGLALSPEHGADIRTLVHRADQALYSIKRNDICRFAVWSHAMAGDTTAVGDDFPLPAADY